jgi:hypothetical protein
LLAQLRLKRALRDNNVSSLLLSDKGLRNTKLRILLRQLFLGLASKPCLKYGSLIEGARLGKCSEAGAGLSGKLTSWPLLYVVHRLLAKARTRFHNLRVSGRTIVLNYGPPHVECSGGGAWVDWVVLLSVYHIEVG